MTTLIGRLPIMDPDDDRDDRAGRWFRPWRRRPARGLSDRRASAAAAS